ncbi:MAG: hypothetical protein U0936_22490 [Planctomycetaceae bacterium]
MFRLPCYVSQPRHDDHADDGEIREITDGNTLMVKPSYSEEATPVIHRSGLIATQRRSLQLPGGCPRASAIA